MTSVSAVPFGLEQVIARFGNPDKDGDFVLDPDFFAEKIRVFTFPCPMQLSWIREPKLVTKFQAHVDVGPAIADALNEVFREVGVETMRKNGWDRWGGCFNFRANRRSPRLSTHAWGIAVDLNPHLAPMGAVDAWQPEEIVEAFEKRGFLWIASDRMHAQACRGY